MNSLIWKLTPLLFLSGFCALAYELVWMRYLRLIFGSSTLANSAVLAIFMGGIGLGSLVLGRKVEKDNNPLRLYGLFELGIAGTAALTPALFFIVEKIYLGSGGSAALGFFPATVLHLFLTTLVIGVPTFLMGGTLPAVAKTAQLEIDLGRRDLGLLYGLNSLGAVFGCILIIFVLLERLGSQNTILFAALLNTIVAVIALTGARSPYFKQEKNLLEPPEIKRKALDSLDSEQRRKIPPWFIYTATFIAGFAFFLLEIVWYRMLAPLLGGTTYTMGIILAVALLGLAAGSWAYGVRRYTVVPTLRIIALVCTLEAFFVLVPFALGDQIAVVANLLRPIGTVGLKGYAVGWFCITALTVFPAAVVAGFQFPMLIGLKGRGRKHIAQETGLIYYQNKINAYRQYENKIIL